MEKDKSTPPGFAETQDEFDGKGHESWPNSFRTREELEAMVESGFASGVSEKTIPEIVEQTLRDLKDG
jgi:hypothetical protein